MIKMQNNMINNMSDEQLATMCRGTGANPKMLRMQANMMKGMSDAQLQQMLAMNQQMQMSGQAPPPVNIPVPGTAFTPPPATSSQPKKYLEYWKELELIDKAKEKGNAKFKLENYKRAEFFYKEALKEIESTKNKFRGKDLNPLGEREAKILLNLALIKIRQSDFSEGLRLCNESLDLNEDNSKGVYRKAVCLDGIGQTKKAYEFLRRRKARFTGNDSSKESFLILFNPLRKEFFPPIFSLFFFFEFLHFSLRLIRFNFLLVKQLIGDLKQRLIDSGELDPIQQEEEEKDQEKKKDIPNSGDSDDPSAPVIRPANAANNPTNNATNNTPFSQVPDLSNVSDSQLNMSKQMMQTDYGRQMMKNMYKQQFGMDISDEQLKNMANMITPETMRMSAKLQKENPNIMKNMMNQQKAATGNNTSGTGSISNPPQPTAGTSNPLGSGNFPNISSQNLQASANMMKTPHGKQMMRQMYKQQTGMDLTDAQLEMFTSEVTFFQKSN